MNTVCLSHQFPLSSTFTVLLLLLLSCRVRPASAASVGTIAVQDRLSELVRMFKGRTEQRKDRLVDPDESEEESPSACKSFRIKLINIKLIIVYYHVAFV